MAKHTFSRNDIQSLATRLEDRSCSRILQDMPELQRDIRSASLILLNLLSVGVTLTTIEIENGHRESIG